MWYVFAARIGRAAAAAAEPLAFGTHSQRNHGLPYTCVGFDARPMTAKVYGPPRYAPIWTNSAAALPTARNSRLLGSAAAAAATGFLFPTSGSEAGGPPGSEETLALPLDATVRTASARGGESAAGSAQTGNGEGRTEL
ncbi:Os06g0624750 [Oryza sativa Japonica Group]|uniref:Os06g0624750 protein n=1 Tax=Oryza sativa subsp. japonica TaxID=39947 RepID=A0A0P0WZ13_ORYSJ|nr:hypothetical protein EE612_035434 [Oryza sativa]BAS98687.1 Os06g0624750 [Oryza sativa Japonica Group]